MKKMKKFLTVLMTVVMLAGVLPVGLNIGIIANASGGVASKLEYIKSVYPVGSYFTSDGQLDESNQNDRCKLSNIPEKGGLTSGDTVKSKWGDTEAWSCVAFARYVFYNIFNTSQMTKIDLSQAKIGDYVEFSGHAGIYLSHDANNVYVYDSNYQTPYENKVGYNTGVSRNRFLAVYRAANYEEIDGKFSLDINGCLDGVDSGDLGDYGTCDVYINGSPVANDIKDFYSANGTFDKDSTYEIKDIKANKGYKYNGVKSGSLSGTLDSNKEVRLSFSKKPAVWWGVTGSQIADGEKHKKNPTVSGEVFFWVEDHSAASNKYAKIWIDNDVVADKAKSAKDDSDGKKYFSCKIDTTGLSNGSHTFWLYLYENDNKTDEIQEPFTVNNTAEISWWGVSDTDGETNKDTTAKPTVSGVKRFWVADSLKAENEYVNFFIDGKLLADNVVSEKWKDTSDKYFDFTIDTVTLSSTDHIATASLYVNGTRKCTVAKAFTVNNDSIRWWGLTDSDRESNQDRTYSPVIKGERMLWFQVPKNEASFVYSIKIDDEYVVENQEYDNSCWVSYTDHFASFANGDHTLTLEYGSGEAAKTIIVPFTAKNEFAWWGVTSTTDTSTGDQSRCPTVTGTQMFWYYAPAGQSGWDYIMKVDGKSKTGPQLYDGALWVSYTLDTSKLENGLHTIQLYAVNDDSTIRTVTNSFIVANTNSGSLVENLIITSQPVDVVAAAGTTAKFTVEATGADSYEWQVSGDNGKTWKQSGAGTAKTATLKVSVTAATSKVLYRCAVSNADETVYSDNVRIILDNRKPVITSQPMNVSLKSGAAASFSVKALGETPLFYQWQVSGDNGKTWKTTGASGANTAKMTVNASTSTAKAVYRCAVKNSRGTTYTNTVSITLTDAKPVIRVQPVKVKAKTGAAVSFSVAASGAESYQWQVSGDNGKTWKTTGASGANTAKMTVTASTSTAKAVYRCAINNANGTVYSNTVSITLTNVKPIIRVQPVNVNAKTGTAVSFSVVASGAASYQWQVSGDNGKTWKTTGASGAKTAALSVNATAATSKVLYRCAVTNDIGTLYSNSVKIVIG